MSQQELLYYTFPVFASVFSVFLQNIFAVQKTSHTKHVYSSHNTSYLKRIDMIFLKYVTLPDNLYQTLGEVFEALFRMSVLLR